MVFATELGVDEFRMSLNCVLTLTDFLVEFITLKRVCCGYIWNEP